MCKGDTLLDRVRGNTPTHLHTYTPMCVKVCSPERTPTTPMCSPERTPNTPMCVKVGFMAEDEAFALIAAKETAGHAAQRGHLSTLPHVGARGAAMQGSCVQGGGGGEEEELDARLSKLKLRAPDQRPSDLHHASDLHVGGEEGGGKDGRRYYPIVKFRGGRQEVMVPEVFEQVCREACRSCAGQASRRVKRAGASREQIAFAGQTAHGVANALA